jgi:tRNA(Ile)-lysidine synthase
VDRTGGAVRSLIGVDTDGAPGGTDNADLFRADALVAGLLARCRFPAAGTPVDLAVSGGPDSTALVVLAVAAGLRPTVVHVDHGLRSGSDADAAVVRALGRRFGVPVRTLQVTVGVGPDLEARARRARHGVLGPGTLFGHTADDQAETVLLRLLRGTGPTGLAAMRPDRHPLLALRRADTVALCDHLGLEPLRDPTNDDPRFTRNRVRVEVLPLLADVAGRDVVPLLCRLADLAADQADLVGSLVAGIDADDVRVLRSLPPSLAAAAVRRRWTEVTASEHPPGAAAVGRVLDVACGRHVACDVASGWRVRRRRGRLEWVPPVTVTIAADDR